MKNTLKRELQTLPAAAASVRSALKAAVLWLLLGAAALATTTGCVSKAAAEAKAREAYFAGQREALQRARPQPQLPSVTFVGEVKNPVIPWTEDMTLAKAIVAAGYYGKTDPTHIVIVRNGRGIQVDPGKLLTGEDMPLEAQDIISLRQ